MTHTTTESGLALIERLSGDNTKLRLVLGALRNECAGTPRPARLVELLAKADAVLATDPALSTQTLQAEE